MLVIVCVQLHYYTLQVMHKADYICICFQKGFQCSIIDAVRCIQHAFKKLTGLPHGTKHKTNKNIKKQPVSMER